MTFAAICSLVATLVLYRKHGARQAAEAAPAVRPA